jgi:hypothetical protein
MTYPDAFVGRHVLRNFGSHGVHKGTISSYDPEGELTFRVDYLDGDFEDLSEEDVLATLIPLPSGVLAVRNRVVRVTARRRRAKNKDNSDCEYIGEDDTTSDTDIQPNNSQATTQPFDDTAIIDDSQQGPELVPATRNPSIQRRSTPSTRSIPSLVSLECIHFEAYVHVNSVLWRVVFKELRALTYSKGLEISPMELNELYEHLYKVGNMLQKPECMSVFI